MNFQSISRAIETLERISNLIQDSSNFLEFLKKLFYLQHDDSIVFFDFERPGVGRNHNTDGTFKFHLFSFLTVNNTKPIILHKISIHSNIKGIVEERDFTDKYFPTSPAHLAPLRFGIYIERTIDDLPEKLQYTIEYSFPGKKGDIIALNFGKRSFHQKILLFYSNPIQDLKKNKY
jgi:hypothetical protein